MRDGFGSGCEVIEVNSGAVTDSRKKNPHAVKFSVRILAKSAIVAGSSLVDSIRVIDDIAYSAVNSGVIHGIDFKCDKGVLPHKFEVYLVVFVG